MAFIEGSTAKARLSRRVHTGKCLQRFEELECFPFSLKSKGSQPVLPAAFTTFEGKILNESCVLPASGFFWG